VTEKAASQEVSAGAPATGVGCQLESFPATLPGGPPSREEPWSWYVRRRLMGFRLRLERELAKLRGRPAPGAGAKTPAAAPPPPAAAPPAPALEQGDWVRVRSAEYIRGTLDDKGFLAGCGFGLGQYEFCGQEFRVLRRVDHFFDEARSRMLKGRNLVLLDGVHCQGGDVPWTQGCQRMCFYFWRTEWLEKIDGPSTPAR